MTGREIDRHEVLKARMNEIEGFVNVGVREIALREQCIVRTGRGPIRARWVDINKGDDNNKVCRSRHVTMEIRKMHVGSIREGVFAVMPPLVALKL